VSKAYLDAGGLATDVDSQAVVFESFTFDLPAERRVYYYDILKKEFRSNRMNSEQKYQFDQVL
jgi:hypothetical protein